MSTDQPSNLAAKEPSQPCITCWACQHQNTVPVWHGAPVPIIACAWCGALTENIPFDLPHASLDSKPVETRAAQCRPFVQSLIGKTAAAFVLITITFVALSSCFLILPEAFTWGGPLRETALPIVQIATIVMYIAIVFFFLQVILRHPGPVNFPSYFGKDIPQGAFTDWRWCVRCEAPKSSTAHHCSRCGTCIESLDHHCIFAANSCIGARNIGSFMTFLKLVVTGACIVALASVRVGWLWWHDVVNHTLAVWNAPRPLGWFPHTLLFFMRWIVTAPRPLAYWHMTLVLSLGSGLGIGLLLIRQLRLAARNTTVLQELKRKGREHLDRQGLLEGGVGIKAKRV